jgi:glucose/arabinose dehydrogenase
MVNPWRAGRRAGTAKGVACRPRLEPLEDRLLLTGLPPGFQDRVFATGVAGTDGATTLAFAPDGRLFVCQKAGNVLVVKPDGTVLPSPFLHVDVDTQGEHGLVGLAFDPDFVHDGYVYVYYVTAAAPVHARVSRFTADPANPNAAVWGSEKVLLELDSLKNHVHVGGGMHFGTDGKLYVGVGEDDVPANAQDGSNLLGKVLRLNADGSVPPDNPFVGTPGIRPEIYAFGFRNPYRSAVDPTTGMIYVNDVGSDPPQAREEVNRLYWGGNYGWPTYQGFSGDPDYTDPLYDYPHGTDPETGTEDCAITGGSFYTGGSQGFPAAYNGQYFFADLCGNWIRQYSPQTGAVQVFAADTDPASLTVDLAQDAEGRLYYLDLYGPVHRIDYVLHREPLFSFHAPLPPGGGGVPGPGQPTASAHLPPGSAGRAGEPATVAVGGLAARALTGHRAAAVPAEVDGSILFEVDLSPVL